MFKKINIDFSKINIDSFKGKQKNNSYHNFHEFDIKDQTQLELLIKSKIKFKINPDNINITKITCPGAGPHTDLWKTALNIYITAGSDKTYFWKKFDEKVSITNERPHFFIKTYR